VRRQKEEEEEKTNANFGQLFEAAPHDLSAHPRRVFETVYLAHDGGGDEHARTVESGPATKTKQTRSSHEENGRSDVSVSAIFLEQRGRFSSSSGVARLMNL
jgi:hypothetical protein